MPSNLTRHHSAIVIPRLAGTRGRAKALATELPHHLENSVVTVDAKNSASVGQGFADELCRQILVKRNAGRLEVYGACSTFAHYLKESARLRGVSENLIVNVRL